MTKPSRYTIKHGTAVFRPSEKPPNVKSSVKSPEQRKKRREKERLRKRERQRQEDLLSGRRHDAGSWYVVGEMNGQDYIISTHPSDNDASTAAKCYRKNGLNYSNIRVERHGQRGYKSEDSKSI